MRKVGRLCPELSLITKLEPQLRPKQVGTKHPEGRRLCTLSVHSHSGVGKDKGGELLWDSRKEPEDPGEALPPIFCTSEIHVA